MPSKLLLFDEIDAPLHPSMSRKLVETITGALVEKHGINVIMATHSPSTVAVAPEESVHVMRPDEPGVHKVSKRQAIAVLTSEIPTLSISFDGRRQVFVESSFDAERYDLLYRHLSSRIESERSLVFIGVGRHAAGSADVNTGSAQVREVVKSLRDGGNETVFGLLDWDLTNEPNEHVVVLAHDKRYAIENCLLDPILLAAVAVRENRESGKSIGLQENETHVDLRNMTHERLQGIVDQVVRQVLGLENESEILDRVPVRYCGGLSLTVSQRYLRTNGHELEQAAKKAFPHLKRFHNTGQLLLQIVDPVILEFPDFVPEELVEAFREILFTVTL